MKHYYAFLLGLIFLAACTRKDLPKGILEEEKMIGILADLSVIDGYMATMMYTDTIRRNGKNFYATVYKKHNINKQIFDSSLKYYSKQPVLLDSMYSEVDSILKYKEAQLTKRNEEEQKKLTQSK
jgi:hypothetical protein